MPDRLVRWLARIVPRSQRSEWLREWIAELAHARRRQREGGRGTVRVPLFLHLYLLAALEDAMGMRMRNPGLGGLGRDLRYAARTLSRSTLFTGVSVLTLALGIGANTAIFSVLWGVVLRPLPYPEPEAVVSLIASFGSDPATRRQAAVSEPEFLDLRAELEGFDDIAGYWRGGVNLGGVERPLRVSAAGVSSDFLGILGTSPALGRGFLEGEDRPGGDAVTVVSHGLWRRAFGSDPGVLGRSVLVDGRPRTVVGVLPPEFRFPVGEADLLLPNIIDPANPGGRASHYMELVARLGQGIDIDDAQSRVNDLLLRWDEAYERHDLNPEGHPLEVVALKDHVVGNARSSLAFLMGAVGLVLLIACANVVNLMLVRSEDRRDEMALRRALGAGRGDLARLVLVESILLGALGGALGLLIAWGGVQAVVTTGADFLPRLQSVRLDGVVLLFTAALSTATGLGFGLLPALSRGDLRSALQSGSRNAGKGVGRSTTRRLLVVAEVGTAVLLVVGAGVLLRSLARLQAVDPGFDPSGVVTADLELDGVNYPTAADVAFFHEELTRRIEALPGAVAAGAVRRLPLRGEIPIESVTLVDRPAPDDDDPSWNAGYQPAAPGYFKALRIPIVRGRPFTDADRQGAPGVALVNQAMADLFWPDGDPVGERIRLGWWDWSDNPNPSYTVVGVVANVRQQGLAQRYRPAFFVPRAQAGSEYNGFAIRNSTLVVRAGSDPATTLRAVRQVVSEVDPNLPLSRLTTMEAVLSGSVANERLLGILMGIFSAVALTLGAVGIYGLVAYSVAARTREIGVRIALGADRGSVMGLVVRQALTLASIGVVVGVGAALLGTRLLDGFLYEVSVRDPAAFAAGPLVLLAVAFIAATLPARRASRVDPVVAMRAE